MAVLAGSRMSFDEASDHLRELCGIRVSDQTIRRSGEAVGEQAKAYLEESAVAVEPVQRHAGALVRERVAWIDQHAFRPMIGVYYGTETERIERASARLGEALAEMGAWTEATGWLAGDAPTLAEAVAMPIHVRLEGLQRLGFTAPIDERWTAHGERCRGLPGWGPVEWSAEQTDEFVGRFEAFRRKQRRGDWGRTK